MTDFVPELPQVLALASGFVVDDEDNNNSDDEGNNNNNSSNKVSRRSPDAATAAAAGAAASAVAPSGGDAAAAASSASSAVSTSPSSSSPAASVAVTSTEASAAAVASRSGASSSSNAVPDVVRTFIEWWFAQHRAKRTHEIHAVYESHFGKLTERYFKASAWPSADSIAALVDNDGLFLLFYQSLWFKHLFAKLPVSLEARADAWQSTTALFDFLLDAKQPADVDADLPLPWLWYIVESFVGQVLDVAHLRAALDVSAELPDKLADVHVAIDYLERLVVKSNVVQCLKDERASGFGQHPLYYTLGYFAIVGAARLRCSLGDYAGALRTAAPIDVSKKGLYSRVIACHVALFHVLALAHLMQRQHADCVRVASAMLVFIQRTRQFHQRSFMLLNMLQTSECLYALLALCAALYSSPLDDQLRVAVRERFGESMARVTRGHRDAFEELFGKACVRHLPLPGAAAAAAPPKRAAGAPSPGTAECARALNNARRAADLAAAARASALLGTAMPQLRSILRLYSSISVAKLAKLLEVDVAACRQQLAEYAKHAGAGDVTYRLDAAADMLHVVDPVGADPRKAPGEVFARQIRKFDEIAAAQR